jgi:hypothetical protein
MLAILGNRLAETRHERTSFAQAQNGIYRFAPEERGRTTDRRQVIERMTSAGLTNSGRYRTRTCDP